MGNKFELICERWAPIALEYMKFLRRYEIEAVAIISKREYLGCSLKIFGDEDKYLKLSLEDSRFNAEEKQITELLDTIEKMALIMYYETKITDVEELEFYEDYSDEYINEEDEDD